MALARLRLPLVSMLLILALLFGSAAPLLADVSANPQSMIYHNTSCRYYGCKACTKTFKTAEEARKAGYRACKKCGG